MLTVFLVGLGDTNRIDHGTLQRIFTRFREKNSVDMNFGANALPDVKFVFPNARTPAVTFSDFHCDFFRVIFHCDASQ